MRHGGDVWRSSFLASFMVSSCRVRNKIIYVLLWRPVNVLTRMLFCCLFPSLLCNSGNIHQNNTLVSAWIVSHANTYIIRYVNTIYARWKFVHSRFAMSNASTNSYLPPVSRSWFYIMDFIENCFKRMLFRLWYFELYIIRLTISAKIFGTSTETNMQSCMRSMTLSQCNGRKFIP